MKVLVVGSGAREHALCWKLKQSPTVTELYCAPGNPGSAEFATNVPIQMDDHSALVEFGRTEGIDLVVVGPEEPLSKGIADALSSGGLTVFGPLQAEANLEASKRFAKEVMNAAGVPNAGFAEFSEKAAAAEYCSSRALPLVVKADGLAAGKGVCVCMDCDELTQALDYVFDGLRSDCVIVEDFLEGREASYIVAAGNGKVVPMASSHDYKRLLEGHEGPNTGGMGSVSPTSHLTQEQEAWVMEHIMQPVLDELQKRGMPFTGFLYAGLMISDDGNISVIEFNVRMGDPECQAILRRMQGDFAALLHALSTGASKLPDIDWDPRTCVCVVAASEGYPASPAKGETISGISDANEQGSAVVFQAGTSLQDDSQLVTSGGRVLSVTTLGDALPDARDTAFRAMDKIRFRGMHVRRDIGN